MGVGALVAAGWTLDQILGLSFVQLQLMVEMLAVHKATMAEMVVGPIAGMFGAERKPGRVTSRRSKGRKTKPRSDKHRHEQKDAARLMKLVSMGIPVKEG